MRRAQKEDERMDRQNEEQTEEVTVTADTLIIADAIGRLADAILKLAASYQGEDAEDVEEYDLAGNRINR